MENLDLEIKSLQDLPAPEIAALSSIPVPVVPTVTLEQFQALNPTALKIAVYKDWSSSSCPFADAVNASWLWWEGKYHCEHPFARDLVSMTYVWVAEERVEELFTKITALSSNYPMYRPSSEDIDAEMIVWRDGRNNATYAITQAKKGTEKAAPKSASWMFGKLGKRSKS